MCKKYQGFIKVKTQESILRALCKELDVLSMKIGEFVDEYFARTLATANKMIAHGEKLTDQVMIVEKILRSLTSRFYYVVCSIEESNDLKKIKNN
jgi:hypothetical protein